MATIYFAYPLDHAAVDLSVTTRTARILGRRHTVYEPGVAWQVNGQPDERVQQVNQQALLLADALVAYYPHTNSVGVPMEIAQAIAQGIPAIVIVSDETRASWALVGSGAHIVNTPEEAEVALRAVPGRLLLEARQDFFGIHGEIEPFVRVMKVAGPGQLPTRTYEGDAGFDLYVADDTWLEGGTFTNVAAGVAVELPEDVWGMIVGRSSTFFKRGLIVNSAVIDQGYRGDLFACVFNPGPEGAWAKAGERLAQLIPMPLLSPGIATVRVEVLDRSDRGDAGFGSSGG